MTRKPRLIGAESRRVRRRPLTQVVRVRCADEVPPGYFRVAVTSPAIYSKIQVLSHRNFKPVFVESSSDRPARGKVPYWAHRSILPELKRWLSYRVFPLEELT